MEMGVAAKVQEILGSATTESLLTLLGIILFPLALYSFQRNETS